MLIASISAQDGHTGHRGTMSSCDVKMEEHVALEVLDGQQTDVKVEDDQQTDVEIIEDVDLQAIKELAEEVKLGDVKDYLFLGGGIISILGRKHICKYASPMGDVQ